MLTFGIHSGTEPMALKHPRWFLLAGLMCGLLFTALLLVRTGTVPLEKTPAPVADADPADPIEAAETWMAIFQGDRKIGVSHNRLDPVEGGYRISKRSPCGSTPWASCRTWC